jgi:hypothetical protein
MPLCFTPAIVHGAQQELDQFAVASHKKAAAAIKVGGHQQLPAESSLQALRLVGCAAWQMTNCGGALLQAGKFAKEIVPLTGACSSIRLVFLKALLIRVLCLVSSRLRRPGRQGPGRAARAGRGRPPGHHVSPCLIATIHS